MEQKNIEDEKQNLIECQYSMCKFTCCSDNDYNTHKARQHTFKVFKDFKKYKEEYDFVGDPNEIFEDEDTTPCFECKTDFIEAMYDYHISCYAYCNQCDICFNRDHEMESHKSCESFRDFY